MKKIAVIGLWHQGVVGAACMADIGYDVAAADHDKQRIKIAKKGWIKYHKHFNSQEIANYMIDRSFNFNNKKVIWEK